MTEKNVFIKDLNDLIDFFENATQAEIDTEFTECNNRLFAWDSSEFSPSSKVYDSYRRLLVDLATLVGKRIQGYTVDMCAADDIATTASVLEAISADPNTNVYISINIMKEGNDDTKS